MHIDGLPFVRVLVSGIGQSVCRWLARIQRHGDSLCLKDFLKTHSSQAFLKVSVVFLPSMGRLGRLDGIRHEHARAHVLESKLSLVGTLNAVNLKHNISVFFDCWHLVFLLFGGSLFLLFLVSTAAALAAAVAPSVNVSFILFFFTAYLDSIADQHSSRGTIL